MSRTSNARIAFSGLAIIAILGLTGPQAAAQPAQRAPSLTPAVLPVVPPAEVNGAVRSLPRPRQIPGPQRPRLEAPAEGLLSATGPDDVLQDGGISAPAPSPLANFAGLDHQ